MTYFQNQTKSSALFAYLEHKNDGTNENVLVCRETEKQTNKQRDMVYGTSTIFANE